jgi:ribosome-associated protein
VSARRASARTVAVAIARACAEKKAENITVLHVGRITFIADYFVIATVASERQARAVANAAEEAARARGARLLGREGDATSAWTVRDFGDVVLHVMTAQARAYYDLEGAWADARRVRWEAGQKKETQT